MFLLLYIGNLWYNLVDFFLKDNISFCCFTIYPDFCRPKKNKSWQEYVR